MCLQGRSPNYSLSRGLKRSAYRRSSRGKGEESMANSYGNRISSKISQIIRIVTPNDRLRPPLLFACLLLRCSSLGLLFGAECLAVLLVGTVTVVGRKAHVNQWGVVYAERLRSSSELPVCGSKQNGREWMHTDETHPPHRLI